jgi:glycine betaine/proline transport system permease protein
LAVFGQWDPAMETLSFVLVAAPVSGILGVIWGVLAYKSKSVEKVITPLLNVAQTMPHFSYLVPVVVFFGIGDHAGAIATIIFATPPMIRLTILGLKKVPPEVIEAGKMSGCKNYQLLFKVLIPTARHDILLGVNQVIMQVLAMAVIASLIGAKGLGFNLLLALNQLRVGQALELGICIVVIAVVLDKLSLAWASKQTDYFADLSFVERNKTSLLFVAVFFVACLLAWFGGWVFSDSANGINYFYSIPHNKGITTEPFWQAGVDWMVLNWTTDIKIFNKWLLVEILMPMKASFLAMPVIATFVLTMGVGYIIGGIRSSIVVGFFMLFIALTPWWERALITMYMMTFAVIGSVIIGTIVGALCVQNKIATKVILLVCDTFQTLPSFIYLIPVIMLFGINDTAVLIAVMVYAVIPPTRYTVEGLRNVPESLLDAGDMSGATKLQRLIRIEFPLAFPHIMLGVNQCVVFALFMVIIGAFIGTDDLGQFILKALSDRDGIGNGLMLGLCVAFIGLAIDHLINIWAQKRKEDLGIS